MAGLPASQQAALEAAVAARDGIRQARRTYHAALLDAVTAGVSLLELAQAIGTQPRYVANAIQAHVEGDCGCQPGGPL